MTRSSYMIEAKLRFEKYISKALERFLEEVLRQEMINLYRYFSVPYFGLACDHGNSFLCLEE